MYDMILHVGDFAYDMDTVSSKLSKLHKKSLYQYDVQFFRKLSMLLFPSDCFKDNARVGDEFMRQIQSIAAYTPYMTCPGNHESA